MRAIWNGMLSFGMVNIPVSVISATRKQNISFNQLSRREHSRIKHVKFDGDGKEVTAADIVKGYEISPGRYVVVEDSELLAIAPESSRSINITDFVKAEEIDTRHYDASYYLVPNEGAGKAYKLLHNALSESSTVAIAKFSLRNKEYLAAIRAIDNALLLNTMLFPNELVNTSEVEDALPVNVELSEKEIELARHLVHSMISSFEPTKYKNEYQERVMALIESKAEKSIVSEPTGKVVDLMAALEASIAASTERKTPTKKKRSKLKKEA
jgi:DNA end-binding protein Ku